jgi:hypothetical protein
MRNTKPVEPVNRDAEKKETEKLETEKREADRKEAAQREIQNLITRYKQSYEKSDIQGLKSLVKLSDDQARGLSEFFKIAEDIKASVDIQNMEINGNNARVKLQIKLSYFNKSNSQTEESNFPAESWVLSDGDGKWEVVSRK